MSLLAAPTATAPLLLGTTLALGVLSLVLAPLMSHGRPSRPTLNQEDDAERNAYAHAIRALRDLEFDHASGKLNEADVAPLRAALTRAAIFAMRKGEGLAAATAAGITDADIEEAIRRADRERPTCRDCGTRPEPDAIYCSNCGRYLPGRCANCRTEVTMPASRYCHSCGTQLSPV